ncbi:DNA mismatch repair protein MutS [Gehongia tenuis]|uniref:DNA mismatch repair protein MutS n=1 Tax=Gehongia tenuis TaxID=2763655 RepID=A0A926HPZ5_9FIRM|nr:DNA mismatch repair protein MutS [Gehongia tenuis]MBC8531215.1 DNA mismatch repair protein MutS [Gehongia tenuis]
MTNTTPMMQQYFEIKERYKDCILMFRLGDFYEMFFEDAVTASRELEITLTGRGPKNKNPEDRAPMCGVPYHSVEGYIQTLIGKGYKVAICEQLTDPAESKGMVERDVIRVITPGTVIEGTMLDEKKNNYLIALHKGEMGVGMAYADVSTGEFYAGEFTGPLYMETVVSELIRLESPEIIASETMFLAWNDRMLDQSEQRFPISCYASPDFDFSRARERLEEHFKDNFDPIYWNAMPLAVEAAGGLLAYLAETQLNALPHIREIWAVNTRAYMPLDATTLRNLELVETLRSGKKRGSLLWVLDKTGTAMGGRLIRQWVQQPLADRASIIRRLDGVEELVKNYISADELREYLKNVHDIQRLISRISYGSFNARDCLSLTQSMAQVAPIKSCMSGFKKPELRDIAKNLNPLNSLVALLKSAIADDPPFSIREGGLIRDGYDKVLDGYRSAATDGRTWITALEEQEREATGIKNLKVGYNKVFGYYIEVTKSYYDQVPYRYVRKQTLANAERYITEELKNLEETILGAEEKSVKLEYQLFCELREKLTEKLGALQQTAQALAKLDCLLSLARVAQDYDYVKPELNQKGVIEIKAGRHPVVERSLREPFVPNDAYMDGQNHRLMIITGPNMAGKSTYMRQVALIVLMAHMGSFVPARSANIAITDRIFTRVGASDDLASGQSTFMVEMSEMAHILRNATANSLLILDEIGRGTSTFDGLSIAWSVVEYICNPSILGAKTLFATHYHELSELEGRLPGVQNYRICVQEVGEDIVFLRKIAKGGADRSFGIEVAKLAGLPEGVLTRAREILGSLETADINQTSIGHQILETKEQPEQTSLIEDLVSRRILDRLRVLDISQLTPMDAINQLNYFVEEAKKV